MTDNPSLAPPDAPPEAPKKAKNIASPGKIKQAERRLMAFDLRKAHLSYRKIAVEMKKKPGFEKYSEGLAYKDVTEELARLNSKLGDKVEDVRRLELERLDELGEIFFEKVKSKGTAYALEAYLMIMEKRNRLLGLEVKEQTRNLNFDVSKLTNEQLERIASGEDPISVLATTSQSGA